MTINFPFIQYLKVSNYQLYPGEDGKSGVSVNFDQGPWVVLGVNGLGKSTLLLIMKRLLTGPAIVRDAGFTGSGSELLMIDRRVFSARVSDRARDSTAEMRVVLGKTVLTVTRNLENLALISSTFELEGKQTKINNEEDYRTALARAMGLVRFEDALRVIDRIVFYLESRETLVWNLAAQFEIFRAILLPEKSGKIRALESEIISADSSARNLNASLYKLSERRRKEVAKHTSAAETTALLESAKAELAVLQKREEKLFERLPTLDQERHDARLLNMNAERKVDDLAEQYEEQKFTLIRHAFAGVPPSDKYIFLKLISERVCPACGNEAENAAAELERRPAEGLCLVCGSARDTTGNVTPTTDTIREKVEAAFSALEVAREQQRVTNLYFAEKVEAFNSCQEKLKLSEMKLTEQDVKCGASKIGFRRRPDPKRPGMMTK